jgi:hypothetical protein
MQFEFSRQFPKYLSMDWSTFQSTHVYLSEHFFVAINQNGKYIHLYMTLVGILKYTVLRLMLKTRRCLLSVLHDLTVRWRHRFTVA